MINQGFLHAWLLLDEVYKILDRLDSNLVPPNFCARIPGVRDIHCAFLSSNPCEKCSSTVMQGCFSSWLRDKVFAVSHHIPIEYELNNTRRQVRALLALYEKVDNYEKLPDYHTYIEKIKEEARETVKLYL